MMPIPNVTVGIDSPAGGAVTTIPFGSGGDITTIQTSPSWNIPIEIGVNLQFSGAVNPAASSAQGRASVTSPIFGLKGSLDTNGQYNVNLTGPRLNFPLGDGVNAFIGTSW